MTDKQRKACEWLQHLILDLNPSFKMLPKSQPRGYDKFLNKFYRINSEFHEFESENNALRILSEKLADKKWFYDDHHFSSIDILAYLR